MIKYADAINLAKKTPRKPNQMGWFVSIIWNRADRKVLFAKVEYFNKTRHRVGVLIHEYLLVERTESVFPSVTQGSVLPSSILRDA